MHIPELLRLCYFKSSCGMLWGFEMPYVEFKPSYNFLKLRDRFFSQDQDGLCSQTFRAGSLTWSQQNALRMICKVRLTTRPRCHHPVCLPEEEVLHWFFPRVRGEMQKLTVWLSLALDGDLHYSFSSWQKHLLGLLVPLKRKIRNLARAVDLGCGHQLVLFSFQHHQ